MWRSLASVVTGWGRISFRLKWHKGLCFSNKEHSLYKEDITGLVGGDPRKEGGLGCGTEGN